MTTSIKITEDQLLHKLRVFKKWKMRGFRRCLAKGHVISDNPEIPGAYTVPVKGEPKLLHVVQGRMMRMTYFYSLTYACHTCFPRSEEDFFEIIDYTFNTKKYKNILELLRLIDE